jgi:hypothetical protein
VKNGLKNIKAAAYNDAGTVYFSLITNAILQGNQYQLPLFFTQIDVFDESPRKRKRVTFDSDCK